MPFSYSDAHTSADIGLIASGESLAEMLTEAALGLTSVMVELEDLAGTRSIEVEISGQDETELLYRWLSEIIYLKDAENFLLKHCRIEISEKTPLTLHGRLTGDNITPSRQRLKTDVKAVTFYKLQVKRENNLWLGEAVLDL